MSVFSPTFLTVGPEFDSKTKTLRLYLDEDTTFGINCILDQTCGSLLDIFVSRDEDSYAFHGGWKFDTISKEDLLKYFEDHYSELFRSEN